MAEGSESFQDGDHFGSVSTSFSQLLFSNDHDVLGLDSNQFNYFSSSSKPPKMLCFGGFDDDDGGGSEEGDFFLLTEAATKCTPQKSGVTCSDSSSASSINNNNNTINVVNTNSDVSKSSIVRKRNGKCQETVQGTEKEVKTDVMNQKACKKIKTQSLKSPGNAKGRKEKLGERIAALQQLVSPYGKTDTASVLHEAMGYIRFLHDQVQVLCSPYLLPQPDGRKSEEEDDDPRKDLRSRGLCLVPLESTIHVANSNGADYWSPAMRSSFTLSPSTMKCQ